MSLGTYPHISSRSSDASTEMLQEESAFPMASQPPQHLRGHLHLHQLEEQAPHVLQPVVDIINIRIVKQTINQRDHRHPAGDNIPHLLRHLHHRAQHLSTHQCFFLFISRRSNQPFDLDIIVIKEEEVDIMKKNDREVIIIQVIKTTVQEHPGNSSHIMSDNLTRASTSRDASSLANSSWTRTFASCSSICKVVSPRSTSFS